MLHSSKNNHHMIHPDRINHMAILITLMINNSIITLLIGFVKCYRSIINRSEASIGVEVKLMYRFIDEKIKVNGH